MNKKIMIIGVGVVALVVVSGSGYFFYQQHDKKLQSQAVNQFISGFETKDFEELKHDSNQSKRRSGDERCCQQRFL